jgi:hypothetical protein
MFATDALFTVQGELPTSKGLGGLERAHDYDSIVIIQPGVYFSEEGAHFKTRGVPKKVIQQHAKRIRDCAKSGVAYPFYMTQFVGLRLSLHRSRPSVFNDFGPWKNDPQLGQWVTNVRTMETRPLTKRHGEEVIDDVIWTIALDNLAGESVPPPPVIEFDTKEGEHVRLYVPLGAQKWRESNDMWFDDGGDED